MKRLLYHPESDCAFVGIPSGPDYDQGVHDADATDLRANTPISVDLGTSLVLPSMDFETYSEAGFNIDPHTGKVKGVGAQGKGGLPVVGTPNYAAHDSTEVLCLYYDLKDGKGRRAWYPGFPDPLDLIAHIQNGGLIEAWNVTFEFWIWNMVCTKRYGWPILPQEQCRCAMAKSRRHSLPGALGKAAAVLGTKEKDKEGGRLIQKLTRPHTPTKNRPAHRWTPATAWDDFVKFYAYCDVDVQTEDHASAMIPDLNPQEFATWQMDQTINIRGVPVDIEALDAMLDILGQTERKYTMELGQITQGAVGSVSELAKLGYWLRTQGLNLPDLTKETVEAAVNGDTLALHGHNAWRALQIRQVLGAANVKKLRTLKLQVSSDGRLRDQYMYCGADRTGRASAGGVQLQNITSKGPKSAQCEGCNEFFNPTDKGACPVCDCLEYHIMSDWTVEAVESAIRCILRRDLNLLERTWGDPITVLCGCLRGLFKAVEGKDFICCDFSAIEAVAAACLSRCQWRIEVFSGHGKIYEQSAANATGIPFQEILDYKKKNGMHHPARKTIGKVRELAGGYGGWINAWKNFGADKFMNENEIKIDVLKWRDESPEIVEMWGAQFRWCGPGKWDYRPELFGLEGAAINAILYPGQCFNHIDITYAVRDDILYCRLPSGRFLHYHRPRLADAQDKLNRGPSYQITFEGYNSNSTKGPIGWFRMETYGGRLFENCIAEDTKVLTKRGWVPIQSVLDSDQVHDGVDWVGHGGTLFKSEQACVIVDGVLMTDDHEVLTNDGWKTASQNPKPYRPNLRDVDCAKDRDQQRQKAEMGLYLRVWARMRESFGGRYQRFKERTNAKLRVFYQTLSSLKRLDARDVVPPRLCGLSVNVGPVPPSNAPSVGELRGSRDQGLRGLARKLSKFLAGYGADVSKRRPTGSTGQRLRVLPRKLSVGPCEGELEQQTVECGNRHSYRADDYFASVRRFGRKGHNALLSAFAWVARRGTLPQTEFCTTKKVYDIVNAGPRQRFVVLGNNGPFIVHNCVQAVAADIQFDALLRCEAKGYPIVMHTHDEGTAEVPEGFGSVEEMSAIMSERPEWASWWPLRAAGWRHKRYQKD